MNETMKKKLSNLKLLNTKKKKKNYSYNRLN